MMDDRPLASSFENGQIRLITPPGASSIKHRLGQLISDLSARIFEIESSSARIEPEKAGLNRCQQSRWVDLRNGITG
jgi:hypothetical protein